MTFLFDWIITRLTRLPAAGPAWDAYLEELIAEAEA